MSIMKYSQLHYLEQLSEMYPTIVKASSEIINLQSILNLPKGTEHFLSDIHGEYEAFSHVLKKGSGAVRKKIDDVFGDQLEESAKASLATLIYYPKEKMELVKKETDNMERWYKETLYHLIEVCKTVSSKYTRSKVRKALPEDYAYMIEELITEKKEVLNKEAYYQTIIDTVIEIGQSEEFIVVLSELIQELVVDHLHVLGDIYDRGAGPHLIMDKLSKYHSVDIQWGNHDIVWMGAAAGQLACIATAIRNSIRYGNLDLIEEGYGINMLPLATFAMKEYADDSCRLFGFKVQPSGTNNEENDLTRKMHKAIAIIRFKLEGQMMKKWPEYGLENRVMLEKIDYEKGTICIDGKIFKMKDMNLPTVDPKHPLALSEGEMEVMMRMRSSFLHCDKLQAHVKFLLKRGSMYKIYNGNLLYHGCVPMTEDGSFTKVNIYGKEYCGKELFDVLESYVRKAFFSKNMREKEKGEDILWYLWTAPNSPLYVRAKMATFERYFVDDKSMHVEEKNNYYRLIDQPQIADKILKEFGLEGNDVRIINGHVPVQRVKGESPVKCEGKVIIIDGGFSKTYRKKTGIAGYTLIYNSYGLTLTAHQPFVSREKAIREELDIVSQREIVQLAEKRILVGDSDKGRKMKEKIADLKMLIEAYRSGEIVEKDS